MTLREQPAPGTPLAERPRLLCFLLALATLVLYLPVRQHGFVLYDDPDYLTENRVVQAGLTWPGVKWAFSTFHASNWHPGTWLSHMLDCECFGLDPGAHHLVNALLHATNAGLLLFVLFRLTGAPWASVVAAALFAWHPLRVESVAWAAERKDVLSGLFFLLTLWAYARHVSRVERGAPVPGRRPAAVSASFPFLALLLFALGLLCKPMLVTLPFVLLLLDYWPLRRLEPSRGEGASRALARLASEKWPFFLLAAASCVVTFLAQRAVAVVALRPCPLGLRLENTLVSYVRYLGKTIWPTDLAVIYPLPHQWAWGVVGAAAAALAVISWVAWRVRSERPHLLVGWLWFLGMLVPVIGLVQVGGQALADRYTYLPQIGLLVMVVFEARYWVNRTQLPPPAPAIAAGLVLAACLAVTTHQLRFWATSQSLFVRALAVTRDNAIAHVNLGLALEEAGQPAAALAQYQEALGIDANLVQVHNNLGNLLNKLGQTSEALAQYETALRLKPAPLVHVNLGALLIRLGRFDEAMAHYAEAARLDPADPRPHYLMGKAWLRRGRSLEAIAAFHDALRLDPDHLPALAALARVQAADVDARARDGAQAVALAERANALTGGEQPFLLDTLAMAYAENGRFEDARQMAQKALERATATGETNALPELQARLRSYESRLPFREAFTNAPAGITP